MSLPPNIRPDPDEARRRTAADPLLASAVRAADAAGVGDCLDVETLGLYADRALRGAALVAARAHVEQCERCRSIVGFVDQAAAAEAVGASAGRGAWGWLAGWRWLVPAASVAAVAVVAVWVNRGPANEAVTPAAPESSVAVTGSAGQSAPPAGAASALRDRLAGNVAPALPEERAQANEAAPAAQAAAREARARTDAREKARPEVAASPAGNAGLVARPADEARGAAADRRQSADFRTTSPGEPVAGLAAGARSGPPVAEAAAPMTAPGATAQSVAAPPSAPAPSTPQPAAPAVATAEARADAAARPAPGVAGAPVEAGVQAPRIADDIAARRADTTPAAWRMREGTVERLRAGAWQRVDTPPGVIIVAVASPSRDVCWAIGASDILRTQNGDTWTRVAPPQTSEPLRSVSAPDASTAVVTTASGVRFRTSNGGATWTRL